MPENNQIYIKLELSKDPITNELTIITHLNPNAPNVIQKENTISWKPTPQEQLFLSQAFQFFTKNTDTPKKIYTFSNHNTISPTESTPHHQPSENNTTNETPPQPHTPTTQTDPQQKIEKILQEKTSSY